MCISISIFLESVLNNFETYKSEITDCVKKFLKYAPDRKGNKARFKHRILHAPNAIQTMHNEEAYLIIYCLNCIRCMQNSTFETGLKENIKLKQLKFM